jgi:hypothetical protein
VERTCGRTLVLQDSRNFLWVNTKRAGRIPPVWGRRAANRATALAHCDMPGNTLDVMARIGPPIGLAAGAAGSWIHCKALQHKGIHHPGLQEPIIERPLWETVERQLREQGPARSSRPGKGACSPLLGKIFDEAGNRLTPSHAVKNRRRYRYYVSRRLVTGTSQDKPDGWRLPAPQIEKLVADEAIRALADRRAVTTALQSAEVPAEQISSVLAAANLWCQRLRSDVDRNDAIVRLVDRVQLGRAASESWSISAHCWRAHIGRSP